MTSWLAYTPMIVNASLGALQGRSTQEGKDYTLIFRVSNNPNQGIRTGRQASHQSLLPECKPIRMSGFATPGHYLTHNSLSADCKRVKSRLRRISMGC